MITPHSIKPTVKCQRQMVRDALLRGEELTPRDVVSAVRGQPRLCPGVGPQCPRPRRISDRESPALHPAGRPARRRPG
jgi:hypothetical protein